MEKSPKADYSLRLRKTKGGLNNSYFKNQENTKSINQIISEIQQKKLLTHSLICGDEVQQTATFLQLA